MDKFFLVLQKLFLSLWMSLFHRMFRTRHRTIPSSRKWNCIFRCYHTTLCISLHLPHLSPQGVAMRISSSQAWWTRIVRQTIASTGLTFLLSSVRSAMSASSEIASFGRHSSWTRHYLWVRAGTSSSRCCSYHCCCKLPHQHYHYHHHHRVCRAVTSYYARFLPI